MSVYFQSMIFPGYMPQSEIAGLYAIYDMNEVLYFILIFYMNSYDMNF